MFSESGALTEKELLKRYQLLSEQARDIILFVGQDGRLLEANKTALHAYGYSRSELLGLKIYDLRASQSLTEVSEQLAQADQQGVLFETQHRRKDGSLFPVEVSSQSAEINGERILLSIIRDISERKQVEAALRESEARFHTLAESAPVLMWLSGTDGLCSFFNKPWLDFTGRTMAQEYGNGWTEGVHPDDLDFCLNIYISNFEKRQPFRMEYRLRRYDGEYRWLLDSGSPMFGPGKVFTGYIGSCIDITERKRNEEALGFLAEATVVLTSSLDHLNILEAVTRLSVPFLADICIVDLIEDTTVTRVAASHVVPEKTEILLEVARRFPPNLQELNSIQKALREGKAQLYSDIAPDFLDAYITNPEHKQLLQDIGSIRSMLLVPLVARGQTIGVVRFGSSVSGRRYSLQDLALAEDLARRAALAVDNALLYQEAQKAVQEQTRARNEVEELADLLEARAAELDTIIDAIPDGVYVSDAKNRLLRVNGQGSKLLGLSIDQILAPDSAINQISYIRSLDGTPLSADMMPLALALKGDIGTNFRMIVHRLDIDEDVQLRASYAPIRNEEGEIVGAVAIASDITELYRLERQKDEFLGIASHELKTPITAIKGLAQLTIRRLERAGQVREAQTLRTLDKQVSRLTVLVDSLLNMSRLQTGRMDFNAGLFDFAQLVRESTEAAQAATEQHVINLDMPENLELVGDAGQLDQVLTNLLSNAIKYSPGGGLIEVRLEQTETEARLFVRDYGIGVPIADRELLFERFHRANNVADYRISGFGVGLYISHQIIVRHGGRIWLEDASNSIEAEVGKGSLFVVALPLAPAL